MTFRTLILRSLRHHWRAHLGVVLGAMVGAAALIGALVVGDSVKESLRERAMLRLGWMDIAMAPSDRFFTLNLSRQLGLGGQPEYAQIPTAQSTVLLTLPGTIARQDGSGQANHVNVFGIVPTFWPRRETTNLSEAVAPIPYGSVVLNEALAGHLNLRPGDPVVMRIHKPTALSRDMPIAPNGDASVAIRLKVHGIVSPQAMGDFGLRTRPTAAFNAFLDYAELAGAAGLSNKANLIAFGTPDLAKLSGRELVRGLYPGQIASTVEGVRGDAENFLYRWFGIAPPEVRNLTADAGRSEWLALILNNTLKSDRTFSNSLEDLEFELRSLPTGDSLQFRSSRIFLDPAAASAALWPTSGAYSSTRLVSPYSSDGRFVSEFEFARFLATNAQPILTYLVSQFRAGTNYAPYSMVTASGTPWTPAGLRDDEIVVNQWLADDLQVKPGDRIEVSYFLPESGARLAEATNRFRVHSIVPMTLPWADRTLMPDFPGIEKAERTQDWDAGFPLTLKIRDKDEAYWKQWRGTPKAFVTLAAGRRMWGNRFGNLTAIRWPVPTNALVGTRSTAPQTLTEKKDGDGVESVPTNSVEQFRRAIEANLLANLNPADLGLRFEPVRAQALKAAEQSQDFGGLFIGFSFFLIAAALILMSLLFRFGLEQRVTEVGTLLALGFTPKQVRRLFLGEGAALATLGTAIGLVGGVGYAWLMIRGLTTIWRDAIASSALSFHVTPGTLVMGGVASVLVCVATLWLTLRKLGRQSARELLAGEINAGRDAFHSVPEKETKIGDAVERVPTGVWPSLRRFLTSAATIAWGALAIALATLGRAVASGETSNAEVFFSAASLLLIAGIAFAALLFRRLESRPGRFTLQSLGLRGCTRRRNRSLAVVGLLACGSFLISAIGAFKLDANADAWKRSAGTGGFALLGESTLPVLKDLNTPAGLDFFGLDAAALKKVSFVPMRVRDGDEASCLNLNRAQKPRLLGVKPEVLMGRSAFTFAKVAQASRLKTSDAGGTPLLLSPWRLLAQRTRVGDAPRPVATNEVPAIGDLNSILWAMGKKVGDTLDYVDERGQPFKVRLVGAVANSVLQGSLLIDEEEFVKRFPGEAGYRMFLIDAPSNRVSEVSAELSRGLQNLGLEVTPAARRLAQFNAVQNTYLNTFQVLGGLGLLLGSAGLGVVVLRNVLERRNEFGVLQAVGFRPRELQILVLGEHGALLLLGLTVGTVSALVAVLPSLLSPAAELPWRSLTVTLGGVVTVGLLATWLATRWALRGKLTDALRSE